MRAAVPFAIARAAVLLAIAGAAVLSAFALAACRDAPAPPPLAPDRWPAPRPSSPLAPWPATDFDLLRPLGQSANALLGLGVAPTVSHTVVDDGVRFTFIDDANHRVYFVRAALSDEAFATNRFTDGWYHASDEYLDYVCLQCARDTPLLLEAWRLDPTGARRTTLRALGFRTLRIRWTTTFAELPL